MRISARTTSTPLISLVLLLVLSLLAAGCGEDGGGGEPAGPEPPATVAPPKLSGKELALIERTESEVAGYCRGVATAVARGERPSAASFARVTAALERLAALAIEKPESPTGKGSSPRLALGDIAENLEGSNCDSRLVTRIDAALAQIP